MKDLDSSQASPDQNDIIILFMQSVKNILKNFHPTEDKYISREFQSFGIYLSEELNDYKHRGLYIKLAKTVDRKLLEQARGFVIDSNADRKGALFMWKLKELRGIKK